MKRKISVEECVCLIDELKRFVYYEKNENDDKQKIIKYLKENINCFSRANLAGHINAEWISCKHQILLNNNKVIDVWFQFGGRIAIINKIFLKT